jgi:site-specific DNA-methyltransferase (adenine-specific)
MADYRVLVGNALDELRTLEDKTVDTIVTSPPYYGLRDYGVEGQIGLEQTPTEFVNALVEVFREARRVLRDDGTLWVNIGDSYCAGSRKNTVAQTQHKGKARDLPLDRRNGSVEGVKGKDLFGIPWLLALALREDGWYLRSDIIWSKPHSMPEAVKDRPTKSHEYIFLLSKSPTYYYDYEAILEPVKASSLDRVKRGWKSTHPTAGNVDAGGVDVDTMGTRFANPKGKNKRTVWDVSLKPWRGAHFATFPPELIEPCILAGSRPGGTVLDPFGGAGTTAGVSLKHGRNAIIIELNPEYAELIPKRVAHVLGFEVAEGEPAPNVSNDFGGWFD